MTFKFYEWQYHNAHKISSGCIVQQQVNLAFGTVQDLVRTDFNFFQICVLKFLTMQK